MSTARIALTPGACYRDVASCIETKGREIHEMTKGAFYIVDVFAERKYAGNQLAVFRDGAAFSSEEMQQLAAEMNYSETTFILSDAERNGGYDVRIFTPKREIPFAGHPTLGTAWIIQREIIGAPVDRVVLNLDVGQVPVTFGDGGRDPEILWMMQIEPVFGEVYAAEQLAAILQIAGSDFDERFPIQSVSTGLPFVLVPLKSLDAVRRARIARDAYNAFIHDREEKAILVFALETYSPENQINARMFADAYGVPEDPATGSANGCLAAWLVEHRYFGGEAIDVCVEQGYEIGRPSRLYLNGHRTETGMEIHVGGKVIPVAQGTLA